MVRLLDTGCFMRLTTQFLLAAEWVIVFTVLALSSGAVRAAPSLSEQWDAREEERLLGYYRNPDQHARDLLALKVKAKAEGDDPAYWKALGQLARIAGYVRVLPAGALALEAEAEITRARGAKDSLSEATLLIGLISASIVDFKFKSSLSLIRQAVEMGDWHQMPGLVLAATELEAYVFTSQGRTVPSVEISQKLQHVARLPIARWEAEISRIASEGLSSATPADLPRLIAKLEAALRRMDPDKAFFLLANGHRLRTSLLARQQRFQEAFQLLDDWRQKARQRGIPPESSEYFILWARQLYLLSGNWVQCLRMAPVPVATQAIFSQYQVLDVRVRCGAGLKTPELLNDVQRLEALLPQMEEAPLFQEKALAAIERGYASVGNYERAHAASQNARDLMARRFAAANDLARHEAEAKYDMAAKEKETALLQAREQLQTQRRNALAVCLALTVLGLTALAELLRRQMRQRGQLSVLSASLQASNAELQAINASRTRVLAAACHDLRQPAHALGLLAEMAAPHPDPQAQAQVHAMKRCSSVLSDMLDMLLDMTQLESQSYRPLPRPFALHELLQGLQAQFAPLALAKGLALEVQETGAVVLSDQHLVRRMLMNLVSNAIKYTQEGRVEVKLRTFADELAVCVQDTGVGIPPDKVELVFEEFVRLETGSAIEGLGIGLPIVKRAAELLGHQLTLTSQLRHGTCVTLTLPLANGPAPVGADTPTAHGQGKRIGVVDDDANIREATAQLFRASGYSVLAANSAQVLANAARQAWRAAPDLVVSDLHLGMEQDGLHGIQALRQVCGWTDVAMVLVTGDLSHGVAAQAASLGVTVAYKPVPPRRLLQLVQQTLAQRESSQSAAASSSPAYGHSL
jgi:signal transduction histidine kinase/ActR/RegA family two-component response regulator